jgi:hypothetical protein
MLSAPQNKGPLSAAKSSFEDYGSRISASVALNMIFRSYSKVEASAFLKKQYNIRRDETHSKTSATDLQMIQFLAEIQNFFRSRNIDLHGSPFVFGISDETTTTTSKESGSVFVGKRRKKSGC